MKTIPNSLTLTPIVLRVAWTVTDLARANASLNICADGTFIGSAGSRAVAGLVAEHTTGKNVSDFMQPFGAAPYFTIGAQHQLIC